ncbi:MAG: glycosyltransferase [Candidatus Omnitrophota bacterium]|nr:glycosyltransferase [Candidatus Omnitrophota bacterium]MDZ4241853.1 glycosyltransferase [Candidatus Omnitrophota bacterium]
MKILVIYATAGAGHKKAAEAVHEALQGSAEFQPSLVDLLDHTRPGYKDFYSGSYTYLVTHAPWAWSLMFGMSDHPWLMPFVNAGRAVVNHFNAGRLERFLQQGQFDAIVSTHFFSNEVACRLKRRGLVRSRIVSVVTDFDVHRIWLAKGIDAYAVASDWTKAKIIGLGVPEDKVVVTGIPTAGKFSAPRDVGALKRKFGLIENLSTVLLATGSFGIGPIEEIIRSLQGIQALVVCGHNKVLYERLKAQEKGLVKIFGLVNNMDELMAVSDVMVTKPGGLSISEALVTGLPMIFFNAIPGQETNNIRVLREHGIGLEGQSVQDIKRWIEQLSSSPQELRAAKERTKVLARPSAARDIVALLTRSPAG